MSNMKRTRLARILQAALATMETGKRQPHCFSAHVPGHGYVNDGTLIESQPEYRRQLVRAVQSEIDNMNYAKAYAEPGYQDSENGVLMANWNVFPRNFDRILERAGYAIEWSDEWSVCEDCYGAVRNEPDGWDWKPHYKLVDDCSIVCLDCYEPDEDEEEDEDEDTAGE